MIAVHERLFVGDESACRQGTANQAVVHACKSPCHQRSVGYTKSLPPTHPHYLALRKPYDLYLNIIDPPVPLFQAETFRQFFQFSAEHYDSGASLLIHCNRGESRSPTLALLFLAKHLKTIPNNSFRGAMDAFISLYENYRPGLGIQTYMTSTWSMLD
jgi:hypothetical protein